ncbi:MAG: hypothetical protein H6577_00535 [Lewinellaceae bacterium]|nr:hypothetical protein [Lewinellaceae bacterium]
MKTYFDHSDFFNLCFSELLIAFGKPTVKYKAEIKHWIDDTGEPMAYLKYHVTSFNEFESYKDFLVLYDFQWVD